MIKRLVWRKEWGRQSQRENALPQVGNEVGVRTASTSNRSGACRGWTKMAWQCSGEGRGRRLAGQCRLGARAGSTTRLTRVTTPQTRISRLDGVIALFIEQAIY